MGGVSLPDQNDQAPLVAMRYLDLVIANAPHLFGRIGRLAWNAGASWEEIGNQLGITKQAAWKESSRKGRRMPTPATIALQESLEHLMEGPRHHPSSRQRLKVTWYTPVPSLESRLGALQGLRLLDAMISLANRELIFLAAEARWRRATWMMIGSTLGISAQAAHKRLSTQVSEIIDLAQTSPWYG
jgi:hypothetical protein